MSQPYLGEIRMFAGTFAPAGWAFCDGAPQAISENDALYQLIGTTYGGDGQSTFNLPNLQGRVPIHQGQGVGFPYVPLAEAAGVEAVTLTNQQMPVHTHPLLVNGGGGAFSDPTGHVLASSPTIDMYRESSPGVELAPQTALGTGGSQPHENMQRYLVVSFIIALYGIYPTQA